MSEKLRQVTPWILAGAAIIVAAAALVVALRTTAGQNVMSAMTGSDAPAPAPAADADEVALDDGAALDEQIDALEQGDFQMEVGAAPADCMEHQSTAPSDTYTAGSDADTGAILGMLRYYTMHLGKAFCDGQPATAADQAWAKLYVDLGSNPANVQSILGNAATTG